jgi:hypothetical protein
VTLDKFKFLSSLLTVGNVGRWNLMKGGVRVSCHLFKQKNSDTLVAIVCAS